MDVSPSAIELVITDIGGVLIKTDEAIVSCIQEVVERRGIAGGSIEAMYEVFGTSIEDYIRAYLPPEQKARVAECYEDFKSVYPFDVLHLLRPFEGVDATLEQMKSRGMLIAVLSCMLRREVDANLSLLKFRQFDAVFSLESYGEEHKRPDPQGILGLVTALHAAPDRTIYVGDTHSDIQMAKNAGVISVAVKTGAMDNAALVREEPDHLVESFRDIPDEVLPIYTESGPANR